MAKENKICKHCNKEKNFSVRIHKADDGDDWATIEYHECECVKLQQRVEKNKWFKIELNVNDKKVGEENDNPTE